MPRDDVPLDEARRIVDDIVGPRRGWKPPPQPEPAPLCIVNPTSLLHVPIPPRKWIVDQWLPCGHVTLNYGAGATGKTLLAQELMTSCATARSWCGIAVTPCKSLALFCEDDPEELHRRQDAINEAYGISFGDLADMRWASGVGEDNVLIRFLNDGSPVLTPRFENLRAEALAFGAKLVVIDTAADTFGGNENDRGQVRQFVGNALGRLARDIDGAVLVNAHPSRSGLQTGGSMDSGSTGWSNSARSRWALTRPEGEEGEDTDPDARVLTCLKANYAKVGQEIRLRYHKGVLVPVTRSGGGIEAMVDQVAAEELFLTLLDRCTAANMPLSGSKNASNFAPAVFAKRTDRVGLSKRDFERAMAALFTAGKINLANYGRPGDERRRLARAASDAADTALADTFGGA